jgi:hypothetical protein
MQMIGNEIILFHRYTEEEIVKVNCYAPWPTVQRKGSHRCTVTCTLPRPLHRGQAAAMTQRHWRVYLPHGRVAHLLSAGSSPNSYVPALCRIGPAPGTYWHGTGSQEETERAESLRVCALCARYVPGLGDIGRVP